MTESNIVSEFNQAIAQLCGPGAPFEIADQTINGVDYRVFKQAPASLRELLDAGRQHGDQSFVLYEGENWSFNTFFEYADKIANQLVKHSGIQTGNRVAIAMRNYPEWMAAYVAIVAVGAIVVPLNSWGKREELNFVLSDSQAKLVFCDQERLDHIADDLEPLNIRAIVARHDPSISLPPAATTLEQYLNDAVVDPTVFYQADAEDPVMIMYTSGTTGHPKGALSNNRNVVQAIYSFEVGGFASAMTNPTTINAVMEQGHHPTSLLTLPLFHVSGCYTQFMMSLRGGRRIVLMYRWNVDKALDLIEEHHVTTFSGAPKVLLDLLEHPDFSQRDTSSLFSIGGGGAACPPKFSQVVSRKLKHPYPGVGYGMTESNSICSLATGSLFFHKPKASGILSPIVDVKTIDEEGNDLPRGETGEILMRSPSVINGYWNRPEENRATFANGWLHTGDIGYLDEENFIHIVDRRKDIIIRGGENISAAEVEG